MRRILIILLIAVLAACGAAPDNPSNDPANPVMQGDVRITFPESGTVIYSEALYIEGTADGLPEDGFILRAVLPDDSILTETTIQPDGNEWSVDMLHNYTGDPTQIILEAIPANGAEGYYSEQSLIINQLTYRPDGIFGTLLSPTPEMAVGGDLIEVAGTASGIPDNTLTISLTERDGTPISEIEYVIPSPYIIDEVLWITDLPTADFTGLATVTVTYVDDAGETQTLGEADIVVSVVAG